MIETYERQFAVFANLKENERPQIGRKVTKLLAPNRLGNKIVTLALKIFQAIVRFFTCQSSKKSFQRLKPLFSFDEKGSCHNDLKFLKKIADHTKSMKSSLKHLAQTERSGEAWLIKPGNREEAAKNIEGLFSKIDPFSQKLADQIEALELKLIGEDRFKAKKLLKALLTPKEVVSEMQLCSKAAKEVLTQEFGESSVTRAYSYYRLEEECVLSTGDFHALVMGIKANFTLEDLDIEDSSELYIRLSTLRNEEHPLPEIDKKKPYAKQLQKDIAFLTLTQWTFGDYKPKRDDFRKKFGYAEYLSRYFIYGLFDSEETKFPDGVLFPMIDRHGAYVYKEAHSLINKEGIFGCVVTSCPLTSDPCSTDSDHMQVIFRGTYGKDSAFRSLSRREREGYLSLQGAGAKSFARHEKEMLDVLNKRIEGKENLVLEFMGHSLGGSDAARLLEAFTRTTNRENHNGLHLYCFSGPSVERDKAARFLEKARNMPHTKFKLRYFKAHRDPVPCAGAVRLGYCEKGIELPKNLNTSSFLFGENEPLKRKIKGLYHSHVTPFLSSDLFFLVKSVFSTYSNDGRFFPPLTEKEFTKVNSQLVTVLGKLFS